MDLGVATSNMIIEMIESIGIDVVGAPKANIGIVKKVAIPSQAAELPPLSPEGDPGTLFLYESDSIAENSIEPALVFLREHEEITEELRRRIYDAFHGRCIIVQALDRGITLTDLQNGIMEYLVRLNSLVASFEKTVSLGKPCQDLVDIAEEFFGRFISVTDANNILLASSRHVEPEDEVSRSLLTLGFHSEKYLSMQRQIGYLSEKIQKQRGVKVYPPEPPLPYTLITSVMKINGQYGGYIVMACSENDITPGTIDSFGLFASYCTRLVERTTESSFWLNSSTNNLLIRLLADRDINLSYMREEAQKAHIPASGHFVLVRISFKNSLDNQLRHFAAEIDRKFAFPHKTVIYNKSLVMLVFSDTDDGLRATILQTARIQFPNASHELFMSDSFEWLSDVYFAYRQLSALRKYQQNIDFCREFAGFVGESNVYRFRDAFCFYWEDPQHDEEIRDYCCAHMLVDDIEKNDTAKGNDDLTILFMFLANERKATLAGDQCHMHRNGVLYRIEKIEALYQFDLDDYLTRQYLETSIRIKLNSPDKSIMRMVKSELSPKQNPSTDMPIRQTLC